jgi:pimeloyl-ACP methyl ester carboxylesterase
MAADFALARSEAGFGQAYATAAELTDELLTSYVSPFAADGGKGLERFLVAPKAEELIAVAPLLAELQAPVQVAWGTADVFFEPAWAERLRELIPATERVTLVPDAMLFWPDERAADLVPLLRDFWAAHA